MDRRTRICIWVIFAGLANFLAYVILYWFFWGEAVNGRVVQHGEALRYFLQSGEEVSRGVFIYSGIHSISIAPTVGAIMLAMLTLAKDRVTSSMRRTVVRGRTLITILATIITLIVVVWTIWFILQFSRRLATPQPPGSPRSGPAHVTHGSHAPAPRLRLRVLASVSGSLVADSGFIEATRRGRLGDPASLLPDSRSGAPGLRFLRPRSPGR
jgi:hypothetical protein